MDPIATHISSEAAGWSLFGFMFFIIPVTIVLSLVSAVLAQLIREKITGRTAQIFVVTALILLSFAAFMMPAGDPGFVSGLTGFVACLWFPAAIILGSLIIPGATDSKGYPFWIFFTTAGIYLLEDFFNTYIAAILGLRFANFLIVIPPPALPYELLRIPEIDKVFIQFTISFVLALLLFRLGMRLGRPGSAADNQ